MSDSDLPELIRRFHPNARRVFPVDLRRGDVVAWPLGPTIRVEVVSDPSMWVRVGHSLFLLPKPELPTEPLSVITEVVVGKVEADERYWPLAVLTDSGLGRVL